MFCVLNVILFPYVVYYNGNILVWSWSDAMYISAGLWILMAWCFSTRASVSTVLSMHPCISSCMWVNFQCIMMSVFSPSRPDFLYVWDPTLIITVTADALAPIGTRPSTNTRMTAKWNRLSLKFVWVIHSSRKFSGSLLTRFYEVLQHSPSLTLTQLSIIQSVIL